MSCYGAPPGCPTGRAAILLCPQRRAAFMPRKHRDIVLGCVGTVFVILVAALSSTAFGRGAPPAKAAAQGPVVGIISGTAGFGDLAVGARVHHVARQTRTKWLRASFLWDQIEPRPGVFRFHHYDNVM